MTNPAGGGIIIKVDGVGGKNVEQVGGDAYVKPGSVGTLQGNEAIKEIYWGKGTPGQEGYRKGLMDFEQQRLDMQESQMNWNAGLQLGNQALGLIGTFLQWDLQKEMAGIQADLNKFLYGPEGIAMKQVELKEYLADVQKEIVAEVQKTERHRITESANVEKERIAAQSKTSIKNTKTMATYGYLNQKFLGQKHYGYGNVV